MAYGRIGPGFEITYELDEFQPFRLSDKWLFDIYVFGKAHIEYSDDENWSLQAVTLSVTDGKIGSQERIDSGPIFDAIDRELSKFHREEIERLIREDMGAKTINIQKEFGTLNREMQGV